MSLAPEVSPLTLITQRWLDATASFWASADHREGLQTLFEALRLGEDHGIHVWDHMVYALCTYGAILKGDAAMASGFLDMMKKTLRPDRKQGYCHYHYVTSWYLAVFGDEDQALSHGELATELGVEISGTGIYFPEILCRLSFANILCGKKRFEEALLQLAAARDRALRSRSEILQFMHDLTGARILFAVGAESDGLRLLKQAMALGRKQGYTSMLWWWHPGIMADLCQKAIEAKIEVEYVRALIMTHNLVPAEPPLHLEAWPWRFRIRTLGMFEIEKEGKTLVFSGKVQQKPLALLKVMIALGAKDVPEEQITDALWPDSEGDAGHKAFEMALVRLRRLIGDERVIVLSEGRLSIDQHRCWIDLQAADRAISKAEAAWSTEDRLQADELTGTALSMYKAQFLPADAHHSWAVPTRERMNIRFLHLLAIAARHHEQSNEWERAIELLEKGLAVDDLSEELYQRLMECNYRLGRKAEAIMLYERCKRRLKTSLGITPSQRTEEIRQRILDSP